MCPDSAQKPEHRELAGRPRYRRERAVQDRIGVGPGDSDVARSAAQVRDGVDVDQMCSLIICAAKVSARQIVRCRPTYVSDGRLALVLHLPSPPWLTSWP